MSQVSSLSLMVMLLQLIAMVRDFMLNSLTYTLLTLEFLKGS